MVNHLKEFEAKGKEVGELLINGQVSEAQKEYVDMMRRIPEQAREKDPAKLGPGEEPLSEDLKADLFKDSFIRGMVAVDPDDVKSDADGSTADGFYYVYWNTENVVTQTNDKIREFSKSNGFFVNPHQMPSNDITITTLKEAQNNQVKNEIHQHKQTEMLDETNDWVNMTIPDGLERHVFVADFNRRRAVSMLTAVMTDALEIKIGLAPANE